MSRILTAVTPDAMDRVQRILAGHELQFVHSVGEAKAALDADQIALVFVAVRFDESRMFDLLDYIRLDAVHRKIPVVAAIASPSHLASSSISGLDYATKIYGASLFLNLNDFPDDAASDRRLRVIVDALIVSEEALPQVEQALRQR